MTKSNNSSEKENHGNSGNHGNNMVEITVNEVTVQIHRGSQTVVAIKQAGNVPLADALEQLIDGRLTPLPDDGRVVLKGGEEFISHVKSGGAS